jgi:hypothetical protein
MKILRLLFAVIGLASGTLLRAADTPAKASLVDVVYVSPEKFTDVRDSYNDDNEKIRDEYLDLLRSHIESHAKYYIPAGQHLALRITDVDMAGDFEPARGPNFSDIRIIKDIYPPRIKLEFTLTGADGKVLKQGARDIVDTEFLFGINAYFPDDQMRYEKALIDTWLNRELGRLKN